LADPSGHLPAAAVTLHLIPPAAAQSPSALDFAAASVGSDRADAKAHLPVAADSAQALGGIAPAYSCLSSAQFLA
jgi:hypothetical protein